MIPPATMHSSSGWAWNVTMVAMFSNLGGQPDRPSRHAWLLGLEPLQISKQARGLLQQPGGHQHIDLRLRQTPVQGGSPDGEGDDRWVDVGAAEQRAGDPPDVPVQALTVARDVHRAQIGG